MWVVALHNAIFYSFWTWSGTVVLLFFLAAGFTASFRDIRRGD